MRDPHGVLPPNINQIIKNNNIDTIIIIGEIFPIIRNGPKRNIADLPAGEKLLHKVCSYNIPTILFKGNMFMSKFGRKYYTNFKTNFQKQYPHLIIKKLGKIILKKRKYVILDMIFEEHNYYFISKYFWDPKKNKKRIERLNKLLKENKDAIFLSHAPPYGYLDVNYKNEHAGSKLILQSIKKCQPKLMLCGHVHEGYGEINIGKTRVINLGSEGRFRILE